MTSGEKMVGQMAGLGDDQVTYLGRSEYKRTALIPIRKRGKMAPTAGRYDCIVIGGGLGGMVCSLALLKRGKRVLLLEKGHMVGGCQGYFTRKGFLFEACLHSVAETHVGGPVMKVLSSLDMKILPSFVQFDPSLPFIFPDAAYAVPKGKKNYLALLKKLFSEETDGIEKIFRKMDDIYDGIGKLPEVIPSVERYSGKVFQELLDECINNKRLKAIISGFWGYLGIPPSRASALILSGFNGSICNHGNYLPEGGITHLVKPLADSIRGKGGEIRLKSPVKKIVLKEGRATGVILENGEEVEGRAVVSNVDANLTFFSMVGEENLPIAFADRLKQLTPTLSAFSVYLGIEGDTAIPSGLCPANLVYPSDDMDAQYEAILKGDIERMPYVISIPTLVNPSLSPAGHHIVTLFAPMPYRIKDFGGWEEKKPEITERLIKVAEGVIPGLRQIIVVKDSASPDTLFRYTGNAMGAVGGWDYTPHSLANRPANETPIKNLWLTGHWTNPGVGIHGVIQSGYMTANLIP